MSSTVEELVEIAEGALLKGHQFPHGRPYNPEDEKQEIDISVPRIVCAYENLKDSRETNPELLERIFYLARTVDRAYNQWALNEHIGAGSSLKKLHEISKEGREVGMSASEDIKEKINSAKLYSDGKNIFAAQLRDPKKGCSASICSNCYEPVAFCDYVCPVCDFELIGAYGMPTIEKWKKMDLPQKLENLKIGCFHMIRDIAQRGDWRSKESPLNRFKPDGAEWGSSSNVAGGTPLTRLK